MAQNKLKPNKMRWCNYTRLRELRRHNGFTQDSFASAINQYLKSQLPDLYHPSLLLTQSIISDLELGKTDPSLPTLRAIVGFLDLDMDELLIPSLHGSKNGNITSYEGPGLGGASDKIFILQDFPSLLFIDEAGINSVSESYVPRKRHIEIYRLQGIVNFLFSPCTPYDRKLKLQILDNVISFFSANIYRDLLILCNGENKVLIPNTASIILDGAEIGFLLPLEVCWEDEKKVKYIKFKNIKLADEVDNLIISSPSELIHNSIPLLEAAKDLLQEEEALGSFQQIVSFYQEFVRCGYEPKLLRRCLSPEIQQHIMSLPRT